MADRQYSLADFDYPLPAGLIAQHPSSERGNDRLLVVPRDGSPFRDGRFADILALPAPGDLLVLNTTKVRHARLPGTRPSGGPAEVLLIHPGRDGTWIAMGKPGTAMRPGKRIALAGGIEVETIEVLADGHRVVRFLGGSAEDAMRQVGQLPLPPYITHAAGSDDELRYQTVYARREGSVAAPTAGLHFTATLLDQLRARGIHVGELDLEVGPGTFKPVETTDLDAHVMHAERFEIPGELARTVADVRAAGGRTWAVGTTVVRALESAAGDDGVVKPGLSETAMFIRPGYRFKVVDALVTNFHLPRSTLLMLVAAFAGYDRTMAAYRHAVGQHYRFYSYGDAMVIPPMAAS